MEPNQGPVADMEPNTGSGGISLASLVHCSGFQPRRWLCGDGVDLITILPEKTTKSERIMSSEMESTASKGPFYRPEHFALSTEARRIAVLPKTDSPMLSSGGLRSALASNGQWTIDVITLCARGGMAAYYSKNGTNIYSLNVDHAESVYRIHEFDLVESATRIF